MKKSLIGLIGLIILGPGASLSYAQNQILDEYIRQGLQSNQGLKQKQLDYSADLAALKEARGLFFPDLSFNARYTVAEGGRTIVFPVGDLMNPVYSTLNMLTGSESFPQIENEEFPFLRPHEHETKLTLVQPIFNSEIIQNYKIRKQYTEIARIDVERYKRELIREITKAYYEHQKASNLVWLADTTMALVRENLRVSQRLFENDKVTIDAVYRSESELGKVEVQRAQAQNFFEATRSYFNFLLNRSLETAVEQMIPDPRLPGINLNEANQSAMESRDELTQIKEYQQLNAHVADLYRGNNLPGLFGVVDYGYQGEEYRFTGDDDFMLASLVMKWNLFQGTVNHQKVKQAQIEGDKLEELFLETQQQIKLEVINYYYALQAAYESVQSARKQVTSARRAYELISRKYSEGQSSLLELIDARSSLTSAAANTIIARSDYFSSLADFEYATGATKPNTY
jgi:outer membrane protein TolC